MAAALLACQQTFMDLLLDESRALPDGWEAGRLAIYRNAYRARLVDALREIYPRTARWVGEAAFQRAAAHHVIQSPPRSWTLDAAGEDFAHTLGDLFRKDPEVSELAWLEWAMHQCFVSADAVPLDATGLQAATAAYRDEDWAQLRVAFVPGTQQAPISHRVDRLWRALAESDDTAAPATVDHASETPLACIVWRQQWTPICLPVSSLEGEALAMMLDGACYGELCCMLVDALGEAAAVAEAGAMLGRWLQQGMIAGLATQAD